MDAIVAIPGFSEPFASLLHLVAAGLASTLGLRLVARGKGIRERLGLSAFVFGAVLMLGLSGTYHLLDPDGAARAVMQRLDHAGIWVMIAGSFSAVHAVAFRGLWRWGFLLVIWSVAITGLVLKTVFFEGLPDALGLGLYLGLGWFGIATVIQTWRTVRWRVARLLLLSGLAYTVGAVYDFAGGPAILPGVVGPHEVFHLGVLLGLGLHWRFVEQLLGPQPPSQKPAS